jgi:hypothetical protein
MDGLFFLRVSYRPRSGNRVPSPWLRGTKGEPDILPRLNKTSQPIDISTLMIYRVDM